MKGQVQVELSRDGAGLVHLGALRAHLGSVLAGHLPGHLSRVVELGGDLDRSEGSE